VEQSSDCSTKTRDNTVHFQVTTQGLSVPHTMCRRKQKEHLPPPPGTVVAFFVILALDTKLPTYLLTYLPRSHFLTDLGDPYAKTLVSGRPRMCFLGVSTISD